MAGKSEAIRKERLQHQSHALHAVSTCGKWRSTVRLRFDIERRRVQPVGSADYLIIGVISVIDEHLERGIRGAQPASGLVAYASAAIVSITGFDRRRLE